MIKLKEKIGFEVHDYKFCFGDAIKSRADLHLERGNSKKSNEMKNGLCGLRPLLMARARLSNAFQNLNMHCPTFELHYNVI